MKPATKISDAWAALNASPNYPRSWSAWAKDRSKLFVTLPGPDILPDGRTIPLWRSTWTNTLGHETEQQREQATNLRNAIAGNKPILGFYVEMASGSDEKIRAAHYGRLLPLTIIEETSWDIIGQAAESIIKGSTP